MKNIFLFACLGFAVGFVLSSQYHIGKKQDVSSYTVRDTLIYKNVDDLRSQARNGNMQACKYLKKYFIKTGHPEEILYYAMVMADKYHEYTTCNDVCNSIRSVFKRYNLGEYDTETQNIISYYQNLSDSILLKKK